MKASSESLHGGAWQSVAGPWPAGLPACLRVERWTGWSCGSAWCGSPPWRAARGPGLNGLPPRLPPCMLPLLRFLAPTPPLHLSPTPPCRPRALQYLHLPSNKAAEALGIKNTRLKRQARPCRPAPPSPRSRHGRGQPLPALPPPPPPSHTHTHHHHSHPHAHVAVPCAGRTAVASPEDRQPSKPQGVPAGPGGTGRCPEAGGWAGGVGSPGAPGSMHLAGHVSRAVQAKAVPRGEQAHLVVVVVWWWWWYRHWGEGGIQGFGFNREQAGIHNFSLSTSDRTSPSSPLP
jgi:hypothetical protein